MFLKQHKQSNKQTLSAKLLQPRQLHYSFVHAYFQWILQSTDCNIDSKYLQIVAHLARYVVIPIRVSGIGQQVLRLKAKRPVLKHEI